MAIYRSIRSLALAFWCANWYNTFGKSHSFVIRVCAIKAHNSFAFVNCLRIEQL